tara:strand:+ start:2253 stop:2624 length:372 start_codon:yes stop_codon:yes gene_type:complete
MHRLEKNILHHARKQREQRQLNNKENKFKIMDLNRIKLKSVEIKNTMEKERFAEVLDTFFIEYVEGNQPNSHFTHLTSLLREYDIIEEREVDKLEEILKNIGDNIFDSVLAFQTQQLKQLNKY